MYLIKEEKAKEIKRKYKQEYIRNEVGISKSYISLILSRTRSCSKKTAYCITKLVNEDAEIEDYFEVA